MQVDVTNPSTAIVKERRNVFLDKNVTIHEHETVWEQVKALVNGKTMPGTTIIVLRTWIFVLELVKELIKVYQLTFGIVNDLYIIENILKRLFVGIVKDIDLAIRGVLSQRQYCAFGKTLCVEVHDNDIPMLWDLSRLQASQLTHDLVFFLSPFVIAEETVCILASELFEVELIPRTFLPLIRKPFLNSLRAVVFEVGNGIVVLLERSLLARLGT